MKNENYKLETRIMHTAPTTTTGNTIPQLIIHTARAKDTLEERAKDIPVARARDILVVRARDLLANVFSVNAQNLHHLFLAVHFILWATTTIHVVHVLDLLFRVHFHVVREEREAREVVRTHPRIRGGK